MAISTAPPNSSARALYLQPNTTPVFTPITERTKVVQPIRVMAGRMRT